MATADRTIRLSDAAWHRLQRLAEREGVTPDVAAERAVERALVAPSGSPQQTAPAASALERAGALIGSVEGPGDLSTREGFGA